MTPGEQEHYRLALLALRNRLTGDVSHLTEEAFRHAADQEATTSVPASDPADQGVETYEHEFTLSLLENQEHTLEEIDEALERLNTKTFGRCEDCGTAIHKARLKALPYTRHCVSCAQKVQ